MNESKSAPDSLAQAHSGGEDILSALFANMVVQQTNMALMCLGQMPHPETGQQIQDLDAARMFIDQLEMLEVKTKGNLDKREDGLLKQSLTALRLAFVEAVEQKPEPAPEAKKSGGAEPTDPSRANAATADIPPASTPAAGAPAEDSESRKKFTKKY